MENDQRQHASFLTAQLGENLLELIQAKEVNSICVFEGKAAEPFHQGQRWNFDNGCVKIGDRVYDLQQLLAIKVLDQVLSLYF